MADRWHLLLNLKQVLERWLGGIHARLRRLPASSEDRSLLQRERSFRRTQAQEATSLDSRARRLATYEEVKRLYKTGKKLLAIARELGLNVKTVRKYAYAETFPERSKKLGSAPSIHTLSIWRRVILKGVKTPLSYGGKSSSRASPTRSGRC